MITSIPTAEIIADIAAIGPSAESPAELTARMLAFSGSHRDRLTSLRLLALAMAADWIEAGDKDGQDREVLERCVAQELTFAAAFIIHSMKRRLGDEPSPARFAMVAYEVAHLVRGLPWDEREAETAVVVTP